MWQSFLNILFRQKCSGCGKPGTALCTLCQSTITFATIPEDPGIVAIFDYGNTIVQDILWQCKYHHQTAAYEVLVRAATPAIAKVITERTMSERATNIVLVPIPQRRGRTLNRGYSQSVLTAKALQKLIPQSCVKTMLQKITKTIPQAKLKKTRSRKKCCWKYALQKAC